MTHVDLSGARMFDIHAHPFLDRGAVTADEFAVLTGFGGGAEGYFADGGIDVTPAVSAEIQRWKRNTTWHRMLVRELAAFHGVEATVEAVVDARNAAVKLDYRDYTGAMFADAGLDGIVFDDGYPLPQVDMEAVRAELPVACVPIYRIEPLIAELLEERLSWGEFRQRYDDAIAGALTAGGYRGVKSIIAYRTGLDVSPLSRSADQGFHALDAIQRGLGGGATKRLRDHLLCRAIELCVEHDVPMQIHTGMGDYEVNLVLCRPAYLMELLRFPAYRACRVILVHTGYPYQREAGYLAHVLPRVYCDISEGVPFAGSGAPAILRELVEMAPLHKISYGSDAYTLPEPIYAAAKIGRRAVEAVMGELVEAGVLSASEAVTTGEAILGGTTRELYGVG